MTVHSNATVCEETPHANGTTRMTGIANALKRRVGSLLNDPSIDPQNRALLRYALEVNDPWLARLLRQIEGDVNAPQTPASEDEPSENEIEVLADKIEVSVDKIEVLVHLICRPGDEPETKSAALLVLMSAIEKSTEPAALANRIKHLAFAHCGELSFDDMVEAQVATFEAELFAGHTPVS